MSAAFDKVWIVLKQGLSPLQEDIQGADALAGIGRQPDSPNPDPNTPPWGQNPNDMNEKKCRQCGQPLGYMDDYMGKGLCKRCTQLNDHYDKRKQGMEPCVTCRGSGRVPFAQDRPMYPQKSDGILGRFNRGRGLYKYESGPPGRNPYPGGNPYPGENPRKTRGETVCPNCGGTGWIERGSQSNPYGGPAGARMGNQYQQEMGNQYQNLPK